MTLRRSIVLLLVVLAAVVAHWHHLLGRNMVGFFTFVARSDLPLIFQQSYSEMLTAGDLLFIRLMQSIASEGNEVFMRLWSTLAFLGFPFVLWRVFAHKTAPVLLVVATCLNPHVVMSIISGQLTVVWVTAIFMGLVWLRDGRYLLAGAAWGVGLGFSHLTWLLLPAFVFLGVRHRDAIPKILALIWLPPLLVRFFSLGSELDWYGVGLSLTTDKMTMMSKNLAFFIAYGTELPFFPFLFGIALVWSAIFLIRRRSSPSLTADAWMLAAWLLVAAIFIPFAKQGVLAAALPFLFFLALRSRLAAIATVLLSLSLWLDQYTWLHNLHFGPAYERTSIGTNRAQWWTPVSFWVLIGTLSTLGVVIYRLVMRFAKKDQSFAWDEQRVALNFGEYAKQLREHLQKIPRFALGKREWSFLALLLVFGSAINFVNLGDSEIPRSSAWKKEGVRVEFEPEQEIAGIWVMTNGGWFRPKLKCNRKAVWNRGIDQDVRFAFRWGFQPFGRTCRGEFSFAFEGHEQTRVYEIIAFDPQGKKIAPKRVCRRECYAPGSLAFFDEQHLVGDIPRIKDGAIYDEFFNFGPGAKSPIWQLRRSVHPFFGRMLITLSTDWLGLTPFAWRLPGAIFGVLLPLLLFFLAREISSVRRVAYIAAILCFADGARVSLSTIAVTEPQIASYCLLSILFFIRGLKSWASRGRPSVLMVLLCLAFLGAAAGTKLSGLFILPPMLLLSFLAVWHWTERRGLVVIVGAGLGSLVTLGVYYSPYLFFWRRTSSARLGLIDHFAKMFKIHGEAGHTTLNSSSVLTWPLLEQPIIAYSQLGLEPGLYSLKSMLGNPVVWWAIVPALLYVMLRRSQNNGLVNILLMFYFSNVAAWGVIQRPTFAYHYFTSALIAMVVVAIVVANWSSEKWQKIYVSAAVGGLVWFLPTIRAWDVSSAWQWTQVWFDSWFFIQY